jgi:hypothetical protein
MAEKSQMKQMVSSVTGHDWKDHIQNFKFGFAGPEKIHV